MNRPFGWILASALLAVSAVGVATISARDVGAAGDSGGLCNGSVRVLRCADQAQGVGGSILQTSLSWFVNDATGAEVLLVAAAHRGTEAYYATLSRHLVDSDLVLYESMLNGAPVEALHTDLRWLWRASMARRRLDGLADQDSLERRGDPRWRACDLPLAETNAYWDSLTAGGRRSQFPDAFKQEVLRQERMAAAALPAGRAAQIAADCRREMVDSIANGLDGTMTPGLDELLRRRDQHIFGTFRRYLDEGRHRRIAMLYGAMHTAVYEPWLRSLGFSLKARTWVDVLACGR